MLKTLCLGLFLAFMLSSCQTTGGDPVRLSPEERSYFSSCEKGGGFAGAELHLKHSLRYSGDFEWDIEGKNLYSFSLLSPFGQSILKASKTRRGFLLSDLHMEEKFHLRVDEKDYLHFNDHWIALKSQELACFLEGKFSEEWLSLPSTPLKSSKGQHKLFDGKRSILLSLPEGQEDPFCAEISWNSFWILKVSRIQICFVKSPLKTSILKLDRRFSLKVEDVYGEGE